MHCNEDQKQEDPIYPSQSSDFLSFNVDSTPLPNRNFQDNESGECSQYYRDNRNPYNNSSGGKYRNQFQQNNNFYQNRSNEKPFRQRRFFNFQQNDYASTSTDTNRYSGNRPSFGRFYNQNNYRQNRGGNYSQNNKNFDISQYYHFTMLEDPWKELVERHNAISKSFTNTDDDENLDGFYIEKNSETSSNDEDEDEEEV